MNSRHTEISGWGRFPTAESDVVRVERQSDLSSLLQAGDRMIPRGLGRSYGDASFLSTGQTIEIGRLNRMLAFDPGTGVLSCEAGVTIDELLAHFVPRGFFPPVTPGTRFVTLGGALACDVHGKNHHRDGSISRHVIGFELLTGNGARVHCSREANADLFWATLGGLGLTGIITEVTLRMKPIETSFISVDYDRASNLDHALELFQSDADYLYSVAWIDCLSKGDAMGRSVLMRGNPATRAQLSSGTEALRSGREGRLAVPFDLPGSVLNGGTIRAFNEAYYRRHPRQARDQISHYQPFFYPLDGIRNWNRMYGRHGFLQYQFVVPETEGAEGLKAIMREIVYGGGASFLAVLKRFGETESEQLLSCPRPGYTLALDFPARHSGVFPLLDRLDEMVADLGGRVYLAKDSRLKPELLRRMYPELPRWLAIKEASDPSHRFLSDLSVRLELAA